MTDGMKSSEFWATLLVALVASILTATGHLSDNSWAALLAVLTGGYTLSRGIAKKA